MCPAGGSGLMSTSALPLGHPNLGALSARLSRHVKYFASKSETARILRFYSF